MERVLDIAAWLGCAFCVLLVAVSWRFLPDTIPIHFDAGGEPDGWGGKAVVLIPPIILLGPFILLTALTSYAHRFHYPIRITEQNAERQYLIARSLMRWLKVEIVFLFASITSSMVWVSVGFSERLSTLGLHMLLAAIGVTMAVHLLLVYRRR
ncbi:MAG: DUF1648 domain-containing protein [Planctomycetes bacterium]|nr:DUF1648 domain-containing protein [Planctomycetota bacterium]